MGTLLALRRTRIADRTAADEAALIARCSAGDREAMGIVLADHAQALERHVARLMGPGPEVEDVLQQVFVGAIRAFPRFRGEAKVRTWLTRIATHIVIDGLRSPARRRFVSADVAMDDRPAPDASADEVLGARRDLERLSVLLDELSPLRRVAFILHVLEGYSIEEVAALTGASAVATKSRIFWGRRKLLALAKSDPVLRTRFGAER